MITAAVDEDNVTLVELDDKKMEMVTEVRQLFVTLHSFVQKPTTPQQRRRPCCTRSCLPSPPRMG